MNKETILIVDDADDCKIMLRAHLNSFKKFDVVCVSNGKDAIEEIQKNKPAAILTDTNMPEMGGVEFLEWCKQNHPQIPVTIFFTPNENKTDLTKEKLREKGAFVVLEKPYNLDEISYMVLLMISSK